MTAILALSLLLSPDVGDLRDILRKNEKLPYEQGEREKAIRALGNIGTMESTRVLEGILVDAWRHQRDAAVSALIQLKRQRDRVDSIAMLGDYIRRRSNPETRLHLATALGLIGDPTAVPHLLAALKKEKDPATTEAVAIALSRLKDLSAVEPLQQKIRGFPPGRAACLRAYGHLGGPAEFAIPWLADPDDDVRAAAAEVLARRRREIDLEVDETTGERLGIVLAEYLGGVKDPARQRRRASALLEHPSWRVRAAAIEHTARLHDPTLAPDLVNLLEKETGRLRLDAWNALRALTGREIPPDPEQWRAVLPLSELPMRGLRAGTVGGTTAYYGMPVHSRRIAFLFDVSGSMRDDHKLETARAQFAATARRLGKAQAYDLFVYRFLLKYPPRPTLERAFGKLLSGKARAASDWLKKQAAKGGGALYDGLLAAIMDPSVDTIYLLSDGVPSYGTVKRGFRVRQEIARRNRWRRVAIHTILLGNKGTDRSFMRQLAEENWGTAVDAKGQPLR